MSAAASLAPSSGVRPLSRAEGYRVVASFAAAVAGGIHLMLSPADFAASTTLGVTLVVVGVAQVGFAVSLRWWTLPVSVLVGAAVAHLGVMAFYVASRTADLAFLPVHEHGGQAVHHLPVAGGVGSGTPVFPGSHNQPVGAPDLTALVAELVVVVAIAGLLSGRPRRLVTDLMLVLGVLAVVMRAAGFLS